MNIGMLQEQGDLGLGFTPITNETEQKNVQAEIVKEHEEISTEKEN